jgi:hypothetical protein
MAIQSADTIEKSRGDRAVSEGGYHEHGDNHIKPARRCVGREHREDSLLDYRDERRTGETSGERASRAAATIDSEAADGAEESTGKTPRLSTLVEAVDPRRLREIAKRVPITAFPK